MRIALALTPETEAQLVAILLIRKGAQSDVELVVPAFEPALVRRRLRELVGDTAGDVTVEPVHEYLRRGHDAAALAYNDAAERALSMTSALALIDGSNAAMPTRMDPAAVVDWMAQNMAFASPLANQPVEFNQRGMIAIGNGRVMIRTAWGDGMLALACDRGLMADLVVTGAYAPSLLRYIERTLREGDIAVDVGAGVGLITVRMAELVGPVGGVVALEPDPELHDVLQENVDMAGVRPWTDVFQLAAHSETTKLILSSGAIVPAVALDDVLPDHPIALVRVAANGAERHVLEGMRAAISDGRVRRVALELVRARLGDEWEPLSAILGTYRRLHGASFATLEADGRIKARALEEAVTVDGCQLLMDFPVGSS